MPTVEKADQGFGIADAARELGVHHNTIRNWIKSGKLPVSRFGPSGWIVRIHPDDLDAMRPEPVSGTLVRDHPTP